MGGPPNGYGWPNDMSERGSDRGSYDRGNDLPGMPRDPHMPPRERPGSASRRPYDAQPTSSAADEAGDTAHVPASSLPSILANEQAAAGRTHAPAPTSDSIADLETQGLPGISTARRRGYDEKARALADVDTLSSLAVPSGAPARASRRLSGVWDLWGSRRLRAAALVLALALLALRAGIASSAWMAPGGGILGWSVISKSTSPFEQVTPPASAHKLTPSEYAALLVDHLTLDQEIGQLLLMELSYSQPTPTDDQMVSNQDVGGILYFAYNITSASQVRASTARLRNEAPIPLLMTVDQEGGPVNRFESIVGPLPSAASLTSPDQARTRGEQDAGILHDNGFNLNLAPVADVGTVNPQLAGRTFGSDPARVATMSGAYLDGLQESGTVTGTVKHFAGLGGTTTDPHLGLPTLNRSRADWERIDVAPYRTLLAQHDVRAIMVTHVLIPKVDPDLPTSLSPTVIDGTLRQELGFQGVVITDDVFKMEALSARYPGPQAAVLAVKAGADMVIGPTSQTVQQTKDAFKQAVASGQLTKERIDLSAQRILTLKIEMGLIPMPASSTATPTPTPTPTKGHKPSPTPAAYRSPGA